MTFLLVFGMLVSRTSTVRAADAVVVSTGPGRTTRMVGQIVDLTGAQLVFRHSSGREETLDAARVVEIESAWLAAHREADRHYEAGDSTQAAAGYRAALAEENRSWVQRRLLARLVWCYRNLGRLREAGQAFLALYAGDPTTSEFDAIPLAWITAQPAPALERVAGEWLSRRDSEVAQLIGASWLLPTAQRGAAIDALRRLAGASDARIAFLAEAQLWRIEPARVVPEQLERWAARVDQMPLSIRAGPYFLLASAYARNADRQSAALAYMRVPILYAEQRRLAARALLAAASQLEKMGRVEQARGLYREVLLRYEEDPAAEEAKRGFERTRGERRE